MIEAYKTVPRRYGAAVAPTLARVYTYVTTGNEL